MIILYLSELCAKVLRSQTFFQVILSQLFNGFEINVKFCAFDTLIRFLWFFPIILISMFCKLWIQRRTKLLKIAKNVYCRLYEYIRIQFCILQFACNSFGFFTFLKKVKIAVPFCDVQCTYIIRLCNCGKIHSAKFVFSDYNM